MASYKPSRATSNTTIKSRYNPLNSTSISYSVYQTNTILPPIHTKYTLNKKGNTSSQPTQINNTNESNKWNFGSVMQSIWSNVIKPITSNDNNTQNNSSQPITSITPITPIAPITALNEFETGNTVKLLDNKQLEEKVRAIVQSDNDVLLTPKKHDTNGINTNSFYQDNNKSLIHKRVVTVRRFSGQLTTNQKQPKMTGLPIGVVRSRHETNISR
eukprot:492078_1